MKLFNVDESVVRKELNISRKGANGRHGYYVDSLSPINGNEYLEPCIRGAEKLLKDPKQRTMMKEIYRGK